MKFKRLSVVLAIAAILVLALSSVALAAYQHPDDARIKTVFFEDYNGDGVKNGTDQYRSYTQLNTPAHWVCEVGTSNCRNNFDEGDNPLYGGTTFTKLKANTTYAIGWCSPYDVNTGCAWYSDPIVKYATTGSAGTTVTKEFSVPYSGE